MTSILLQLVPYIAAALAGLGLLWRIYVAGQKSITNQMMKERLKARDIADDIDDAVAGRAPDANRDALKGWGRKP